MRLGKYLSSLTKPELDFLKEQLNLTDDESNVFILKSRGKTNIQIAEATGFSSKTIERKTQRIRFKINKIQESEN